MFDVKLALIIKKGRKILRNVINAINAKYAGHHSWPHWPLIKRKMPFLMI